MTEEDLYQDETGRDAHLRKLAHDLRNCLYTIRTGIDILREGLLAEHMADEEGQAAKVVGWMQKDQEKAARLIDELVAAAREKETS